MTWSPYPEYCSTGFTEVGDVPVGWRPVKLRHVLSVNPSVPLELRREPDKAVTFLPMELIGEDGTLDLTRTRPVGEVLAGYSYFANGDVLFAKVTPCFENGKGAVVRNLPPGHGFGTSEVTTLRPKLGLNEQFLGYLTRSDRFRQSSIAAMTGAGGLKRVPDEHVREFPIALPLIREQSAIVRFLDRETAKIDALIGKQEQLIATLREDRTATICRAVTKGLDPNVELKDSGEEWLGRIPKHWTVNKVSRMFRAMKSPVAATLTKEYCANFPGEYAVYSGQTSNEGVLARVNFYEFDFGDTGVLLSTTVGAKAMSVMHIFGRFNLSQNCMIIAPRSTVPMRFYFYHYQALFAYERLFVSEHMQASFRMEDLYGYRIAVPPFDEQREIARFLDTQCTKIDSLIAKANEVIETLREYRSALITDAVTGKIDVRGMA